MGPPLWITLILYLAPLLHARASWLFAYLFFSALGLLLLWVNMLIGDGGSLDYQFTFFGLLLMTFQYAVGLAIRFALEPTVVAALARFDGDPVLRRQLSASRLGLLGGAVGTAIWLVALKLEFHVYEFGWWASAALLGAAVCLGIPPMYKRVRLGVSSRGTA
jgi:hypothetical protein